MGILHCDTPEVTVVIPAYNRDHYLAESIDSVLAQEFQPFEIIVVDDGSTDDTQKILSRYKGRIISIYQPNAGFAAARERGIRQARSPLIAFHDSDDLMLPGRLTAQVAFMGNHPQVAAVCGNAVVQGQEDTNYLKGQGVDFGDKDWVILENAFAKILLVNFMVDPASTIRRECFLEVGGYDKSLRVSADKDLWLRLAKCWPLACINQPFVWIRRELKDHLTASPAAISCQIRILDKYIRCRDLVDKEAFKGTKRRLWSEIKRYLCVNIENCFDQPWRSNVILWSVHLPWHKRLCLGFAVRLSDDTLSKAKSICNWLRKTIFRKLRTALRG